MVYQASDLLPTISFKDAQGNVHTYEERAFILISNNTAVTDRDHIFNVMRKHNDNILETILELRPKDAPVSGPIYRATSTVIVEKSTAPSQPEVTTTVEEEIISEDVLKDFGAMSKNYNEEYQAKIDATKKELSAGPAIGASGKPARPMIGFGLVDDKHHHRVHVKYVYEGGPADQVGIEPGAWIKAIGNIKIKSLHDMTRGVQKFCKVREFTSVTIQKGHKTKTVALWIMTSDPEFESKPYYFDKETAKKLE